MDIARYWVYCERRHAEDVLCIKNTCMEYNMRHGYTVLLAGLLALGLTVQAQAAPKGFTDHKTSALTIALPSDWQLAPKEVLDQLQQKAGPMQLLLAAKAANDVIPQITVIEQPGDGMSQADLLKMDKSGVDNICKAVAENTKTHIPNMSDFSCERLKAAKGSALATRFTMPAQDGRPAVTSVSWAFYKGDKVIVVSAAAPKSDNGNALSQVMTALKSVQLTGN